MKIYSENKEYKLYKGSMLDMLQDIEPCSIDAIVTDPPYELNFMNKGWDNSGIAFQKETWKKCFSALKSGGYLLAFGGSRTFHRIAVAIEDAGFEIRDTIMWIYGSGFPKSMNLGKSVESKLVNGSANPTEFKNLNGTKVESGNWGISKMANEQGARPSDYSADGHMRTETVDYTTEQGKQWDGWGTCLKPAYEPIIIARKPCEGSVTDNVLKYGVGGLNIDECRVGDDVIGGGTTPSFRDVGKKSKEVIGIDKLSFGQVRNAERIEYEKHIGRFPANVMLTYDDTDFEEVCGGFPNTKSNGGNPTMSDFSKYKGSMMNTSELKEKAGRKSSDYIAPKDSGNASRYFMNCKYTRKDDDIWKQLLVSNVENNLEILKATKDSIVQMNVEDLLKELKDHYAKCADSQLDLIETSIVQDIVKMLTWDFKIGTSKVMQDFITNYKKCTQFLNLVQFVEKMDNIDTTLTTQNLLKLFGYVRVVITNYIQGNIEYDQKRYIYAPKASKKDRDEGLDNFVEKQKYYCDGSANSLEIFGSTDGGRKPLKNIHPTVKPTELMQYLVRLVTPNGGTILDPFNGSGSTGKAVMYENVERNKNYKYIGIDLNDTYLEISRARIEYAQTGVLSVPVNADSKDVTVDEKPAMPRQRKLF